jgi:hypothetical protein
MLVLGHVGLTIGLARALSREVDVRWVAAASMLPDLIDKPLRYCIAPAFTQGNTRTVGHSLTVVCVSILLVLLLRRTIRTAWVVALVLPMHMCLDSMWLPEARVSFLWPWAGNEFPPVYEEGWAGLWDHLMHGLGSAVNLGGELAGLLVLGYWWRKCGLSSAARRARVWQTGLLVPTPDVAQSLSAPSPPGRGLG